MTQQPMATLHPFDPWGGKAGGIESWIRLFFYHAPKTVDPWLIGVTEDAAKRPLRQWTTQNYQNTPIQFYPVMKIRDPNHRAWLPLFLRYPLRLRRQRFHFPNALCLYHRVEPLAFSQTSGQSHVLFLHSHPQEWIASDSEVKWKFLPKAYYAVERHAVAKAGRIYCVNRSTVDYMQQQYPQKQAAVNFLPNFYDETQFIVASDAVASRLRTEWADRLNIAPEAKWILFAGRLEEQKNPLLALEAFEEIKKTHPDTCLLMAGDGRLKKTLLHSIQKQGLEKEARLLGSLNADELAGLMQASDVYLLTSRFEGMPLSVLEALACGLPVAAPTVGELPIVLENGRSGRMVHPPTPQTLAEAVSFLLNNPLRYTPQHCAQAAAPYKAREVLQLLYHDLMQLCKLKP